MRTSPKGIDLIRKYEGLKLKAYQDSVGVWTIGYGHTGDVSPTEEITSDMAYTLLLKDVSKVDETIRNVVTYPLNQNQYDALASFTFNLGSGTLERSSLLSKLNAGDLDGASNEFPKWVHAGGKVLPGLVSRREDERSLFLTPV